MKKLFNYIVFTLVFFSCGKNIHHDDIHYLNGYWEIKEVVFPNGVKKEYTINETIDFFKWNDSIGSRTKVKPQLDGTYVSNYVEESIKLSIQSGQYILNYQTDLDQWQEIILKMTNDELILQNEKQIQYHYKRYEPINLE
ncbi:MAG: hypothetical protein ACK4RM_00815 [Flavobacterium sp.]